MGDLRALEGLYRVIEAKNQQKIAALREAVNWETAGPEDLRKTKWNPDKALSTWDTRSRSPS
jgi:hypothetical protein